MIELVQAIPDYEVLLSLEPEELAGKLPLVEWKFVFDFEKVLVFLREPGGSGKVIELQRTYCFG